MLVSEILNGIKLEEGYVTNSLVLKSYDTLGGTYKYLVKLSSIHESSAYRKEVFIAANGTEGDSFVNRTVITYIEVKEAR